MAYAYSQGPPTNMPFGGGGGGYDQPMLGKTLWMGELDQWMDENYIRQLWWSLGEEVSCRLSIDKYGGSYAFVEFNSHESASKALATLNGTQIPSTNHYFKLNWSSRDSNGMPFGSNMGGNMMGGGGLGGDHMGGGFSIFVGDLGQDVDDAVLMAAFQTRYASVRSAKVMMDPATGYSRGFGFIRFMDEGDQQRALEEMQGIYVGSRPIRVSVARPRAKFDVGLNPNTPEGEITTVFVGGLNNTITEEELCAYFGTCGEIMAVKIISNKNIAFIQFDTRVSAEKAIAELNGSHLGGAKLRLSFGRSQLNIAAMPSAAFHYGSNGLIPPQQQAAQNPMYQQAPRPLPPQPILPPPPPPVDLVDPRKPILVEEQNDQFLVSQEQAYANWNAAICETAVL